MAMQLAVSITLTYTATLLFKVIMLTLDIAVMFPGEASYDCADNSSLICLYSLRQLPPKITVL